MIGDSRLYHFLTCGTCLDFLLLVMITKQSGHVILLGDADQEGLSFLLWEQLITDGEWRCRHVARRKVGGWNSQQRNPRIFGENSIWEPSSSPQELVTKTPFFFNMVFPTLYDSLYLQWIRPRSAGREHRGNSPNKCPWLYRRAIVAGRRTGTVCGWAGAEVYHVQFSPGNPVVSGAPSLRVHTGQVLVERVPWGEKSALSLMHVWHLSFLWEQREDTRTSESLLTSTG